jgi:uncharacterized protein YecT (DUF1311 family)
MNTLPKLELPKRWEFLEQRAKAAGLEPSQFVERVDDAANRIDYLLQRVRTGGGGLFEVFYGLSGSGKTTFLKTLPRHFQQIRLLSFPKNLSLAELPEFILGSHVLGETGARIVLIERRDNPLPSDMDALSAMFAELLETFRDHRGAALVLWPVTRQHAAKQIAQEAWVTGRDSMVDAQSRGLFDFKGLPRNRFYSVADTTTRNLTGDGLEAFGVTSEVANNLLSGTETIADFFSAVDLHAEAQRSKTWSVLKTHVRARLWVVLPGDLPSAIRSTVSSLTQGSRNRVDLDLIAEFIDAPDNKALYVADWKSRRAAMAHLLRAIDLRLFPLPPNVSLAAIRAFGDEKTRVLLKQSTAKVEDAKDAMRASRLYKAVLAEMGIETTPYAGSNRDVEETANEYRRVQAIAAKGDKQLNKALGLLLEACLAEDAPKAKVLSERQSLPNCELKPDVSIELDTDDYICLEPTWRSTEKGIPGELAGGQNTLAESHMKKYLLDKATQYVKALDL